VSTCTYRCDNPKEPYEKYYCKPGSMKIITGAENIKEEIRMNGPVIVGFSIFEDFVNYKSGIYQ